MSLKEFLKANAAKVQTPFAYLVRIILVISIAYSLYFHLWRILFINLLLLILIFIPILSRKINIELPREIDFMLFFFIIASLFLGELRGLVIQIFFGIAIGFVGFALMIILYKNSGIRPNYPLIILFSISISLALGTLSEIAKFYLKLFLRQSIAIGDYNYAMISLTLVLGGALLASLSGLIYMKGAKISLLDKLVDRFKSKNPRLFIERTDSPEEVIDLIKKGENEKIEFKSTLRTNLHTGEPDKRIEQTVLKTIAAFLNTEGGTLLIGVADTGSILGIERDHFQSSDKFNLHFTNLIKEYIGNQNLPYMHFELIQIEEKNILKVDCQKAGSPVFITFHKIEEFFMRTGAATIQLTGKKLVDYVNNKFKK
ncbi:hypothetical protein CMI38_03825 [Candidatus Pacearchaeota archaeon]|nr:hypothetical protein [Candidatus Pacearchaeota archaeon]|tara:strand:+ start:10037 stop:11149 length:1113 start_codon:yes stop_codon:yes gene_type:complete